MLLPSSPRELSPQHLTVPPEMSAQLSARPTATAVALDRPDTVTGVVEHFAPVHVVVVAAPSSPYVLSPQHWTAPVESTTQECDSPVASAVAVPPRPFARPGDGSLVVPPLPSCPCPL